MTEDLLGYDEDGLPIWAMFGAEDGDGDDGDDTSDGDDSTDDTGDDGDDDDDSTDDTEGEKRKQPRSAKVKDSPKKESTYRPPSQKEWERTQAALKLANDQQRAARKAALDKAKKEGMDEASKTAREKALEEAESTWKPRVVNTEAKAELLAMGCKNPTRLIKLIDRDKITIQDDGSLLGLEGQLSELKDEWPELFRTDDEDTPKKTAKKEAPPAKKVGAAAGSSKKDEGEEKKDNRAAALVAARLLGMSA